MSARRPATAAKPRPAAPPDELELKKRLEEREAQLGCAADKLERQAATQTLLRDEQAAAAAQLSAERTQFGDLSAFLRHSLAEQTARADGLQRSLADALACLEAAQASAAQAAAAAEERRAAEAAAAQAVIDGQRERLQQADAFLAERDQLVGRAQQAAAQLEEETRLHHKLQMDRERKHAADRELWRRQMAEAVQQAREEMAALSDQRLDATTQRTLIENEEMAGELQYRGRHVPALLARNSALQKEVTELRVQLSIGRRNEEELAKKVLACERAAESLVARLEALEAQRAAGKEAAGRLATQLEAAREEARSAERRAAAQASHAEELQAALDAAKLEVQRMKDEREDGAAFLLACLADARQELLSQQGRAGLAGLLLLRGTAAPASVLSAIAEQPQHVGGSRPSKGSTGPPDSSGQGSGDATPSVQLAELPPQQRGALLRLLLGRLGVDWGAREGLLLPATSDSCPSGRGGASAAAPTAVQGVRSQPVPAAVATVGSPGAAPSKAACLRSSSSSALSSGSKGVCSRSELLELVLSDVRPWGGRSLSSGRSAGGAASAGVSSHDPGIGQASDVSR